MCATNKQVMQLPSTFTLQAYYKTTLSAVAVKLLVMKNTFQNIY